ncbi:hypothetical protein Tco_1236648 [Tanacetum coccineum]
MKSCGDQINEEAVVSKLVTRSRGNSSQEQTKENAFQVKGDSSSKVIVESSDFRGNNRGGYRVRGRGRGRGGGRSESDERQNRTPFNGKIATSMATKMLIVGANRKVVPYTINTARSMDIEMLIVGANKKASNTVPI